MNSVLLERIASVSSRLEKAKLIEQMDEETQHFVKLALDPDVTFGITVDEDTQMSLWDTRPHRSTPDNEHFWPFMKQFLQKAASRELTGSAASATLNLILQGCEDQLDLKWACRIVNRQLRAGFDISTFNIVFGVDAVEKFKVQLAVPYEGEELLGLWYFQPKLDGNRVILIDGLPLSRNGKIYDGAKHVVSEILEKDPDFFKKWVLDGEMMGNLGFDQSSGALRRIHDKGRAKAEFTYWAFDLIDREEWEAKRTRTLFYRSRDLWSVVSSLDLQHTKVVRTGGTLVNPTLEQAITICEDYAGAGFEGAMMKDSSAPYQFKRSDAMYKLKLFSEDEFRVKGFYEGKGKYKGMLGGLWVAGKIKWAPPSSGKPLKDYEIECKVGSGFDDDLRRKIWVEQEDWLDAVVTIKFQEATAKGSLRFPVFKMRRKEKEE